MREGVRILRGVDAVAIRVEMAKLGVHDKCKSKVSKVERENLESGGVVERVRGQVATLTAGADDLWASSVASDSELARLRPENAK
jgi:hypothetical protein